MCVIGLYYVLLYSIKTRKSLRFACVATLESASACTTLGISLALLLLLFLRWCGVLGFSYPFFPFVGVRVWRLGELIIYIGSSYVYGPMHFPGKDMGEAPQARCFFFFFKQTSFSPCRLV